MKIPYTALELRVALIGLDEEKFNEKKMSEIGGEIEDEMGSSPKENKDLNMKIAEHHGISVERLVDSPNYKILVQEYEDSRICQLIKKLVEKLGITDKEAWALMAYALGLLR